MSNKITLGSISSGYDLSKINTNFQTIQDELNNRVLYRSVESGETNTLEDDIDCNGKRLYNLGGISLEGFADLVVLTEEAQASADAAALSEANADASEAAALAAKVDAEQAALDAAEARDSVYGDLASTAAGKGAELVALDDGASGSLWTTVKGFVAKLRSSAGASVVGFDQTVTYGEGTIGAKSASDRVSVTSAPWNASTSNSDNRAKIIAADAWCAAHGRTLWFPAGVYRCSDGIERTADWAGEGSPQLAPFPLVGDDKQYLRPGYKDKIPGAVLLFTGTGSQTATTQRSDAFASFTYCVKDAATGLQMKDLAIVLDCDVYDAGGSLTTYGSENSADYDVGHYIDDAAQCLREDVVVFGYFPLAGTVLRSVLGNDDPDYNIFRGGSTMGRYGLALIGSESNDGFDSGLSGTMSYGMDIFTIDHHARGPSTAATIYANADTWRCIYIDGYTDAANADINGHYFFGGSVRTYAIHPVEFDCASQANFIGCIFETSDYASVVNAATKQWLASTNTQDIGITNCRFAGDVGLLGASFAGSMKGQLTVVNCPGLAIGGGVLVAEKDPASSTAYWVKVGGASGASGDPAVQFGSGAATSSSAGWSIRRDIDTSDLLDFRWGGASVFNMDTTGAIGRLAFRSGSLVISAGVVTLGLLSYYTVDTEAIASTDDLDTINGGTAGQILILRAANSARDIVLTEAGNIRLNAAGNFTLTNSQDRITLQYDGVTWNEISRSDNTA